MKKIIVFVLVLLMTSMIGCNNENSSFMDNRIEEETIECMENEMVTVESDKTLAVVDFPTGIDIESYEMISGYENQISGYVVADDKIEVLTQEGELVETIKLSKPYRVSNFKQIGAAEYLLGVLTKRNDERLFKVVHLKDGKEVVLYDDSTSSDMKLQFLAQGMTLVNDILYIISWDGKLYRVNGDQPVEVGIKEKCIDVNEINGALGVLMEESLAIVDVSTDKVKERISLDVSSPLKLTNPSGSGISILTENAIYRQVKENEFKKVSLKTIELMFSVEGFYVFPSGQMIVAHNEGTDYFDFYDASEVAENVVDIGVMYNWGPHIEAIKKLDFGEIVVDTINYHDILGELWTRDAKEKFFTKVSTDYLTNSAPDIIIYYDSYLNLEHINQGYIADLNPLMENDPTFNLNLYEENLMDACLVGDKRPFIYIEPTPFFVEFNSKLINELGITIPENLNMNDLYDMYLTVNDDLENPKYHIGINMGEGDININAFEHSYFYESDLYSFIDFENKAASFASEEFLDFINKAKVMLEGINKSSYSWPTYVDSLGWGAYAMNTINGSEIEGGENSLFVIHTIQHGFHQYPTLSMESIIKPIPTGFNTDKRKNGWGYLITITENCKDKEKAWEVVKKLISEEAYNYGYTKGMEPFSIIKLPNELKAEEAKAYEKEVLGEKFDKDATDERLESVMEVLRADISLTLHTNLVYDMNDDILRFLTGEISAEELSVVLQNKAELYLGE